MYTSLIESIRSSLVHLRGFQLLVLLSQFIEITFFFCNKRINLLNLKQSSDRLVIVAKGLLKLPNLHMLIKQGSIIFQELALGTFGELPTVFSTKVNLLIYCIPDCIPAVVLKNCQPELSYIPAELFNMCMKESCFPDCWKVSSVFPVFKNVGEWSTAKDYCPVSLLSVVK